MSFPNFKNKHSHDSMITPNEVAKYRNRTGRKPNYKCPKGVVFIYDQRLFKYIKENHPVLKVENISPQGETYLLSETNNKIAIIGNFGVGAPAAAIKLEAHIQQGVKKFLSIGTAGTLQKNIKIGNIMVCEKAIRDDGTSHHYKKYSKYAFAGKEITQKIINNLKKNKIKHFVGTSWTIDAPYRETIEEARHYQKEGVSTVEMEASALFTIAEYRKIQLGAIFTISDSLAELQWKPKFKTKKTNQGLEKIFKIATETLLL
jgi:uridine phosphorylase